MAEVKSDATKKVKRRSPQEMFVELSVSGKALYYMANSAPLQEGTTVLCDDMNLYPRECLKRCSTNFSRKRPNTTRLWTGTRGAANTAENRMVAYVSGLRPNTECKYWIGRQPLSVDESETTDKAVSNKDVKNYAPDK